RFRQQEIRLFLPYLELSSIRFRNRYSCTAETAICILLYRLSAPNRLKEDMKVFRHSRSWISSIFNDVVEYLVARYSKHMEWDKTRLTRQQILRYTNTIEKKGGVKGVWGFIDGTMRAICRPTLHQQQYYSGYKKCHGFKFQAVMTPDGILSCLAGPWLARQGDWSMFVDSGLAYHLRAINVAADPDQRCYLYGDPAYAMSYGIVCGYKATTRGSLDPVLKAMNAHMSSMRVSVEHGFGKAMTLWLFNGFKGSLKSGLSPVAGYFLVAVFLSNIHSCLYRNETCERFHCDPPSLACYLSLHPSII
ncbi:hypothetical protein L873DRAFT_1675815, partial [Choiromyces venosus 120613-1]